jgi:hypothetical protein
MLHLFMALCWLILAGLLFGWRWSDPGAPAAYIWGTGIPLGWFGVAMALYNLLRWWLDRSAKKTAGQRSEKSSVERQRAGEPDPNFDFRADSPKPG